MHDCVILNTSIQKGNKITKECIDKDTRKEKKILNLILFYALLFHLLLSAHLGNTW